MKPRWLVGRLMLGLLWLGAFGAMAAEQDIGVAVPADVTYVVQARACRQVKGEPPCRWTFHKTMVVRPDKPGEIKRGRSQRYYGLAPGTLAKERPLPASTDLHAGMHEVMEGFVLRLRPVVVTGTTVRVMYELETNVIDAWETVLLADRTSLRMPQTTNTKLVGTVDVQDSQSVELARGGYRFELKLKSAFRRSL